MHGIVGMPQYGLCREIRQPVDDLTKAEFTWYARGNYCHNATPLSSLQSVVQSLRNEAEAGTITKDAISCI